MPEMAVTTFVAFALLFPPRTFSWVDGTLSIIAPFSRIKANITHVTTYTQISKVKYCTQYSQHKKPNQTNNKKIQLCISVSVLYTYSLHTINCFCCLLFSGNLSVRILSWELQAFMITPSCHYLPKSPTNRRKCHWPMLCYDISTLCAGCPVQGGVDSLYLLWSENVRFAWMGRHASTDEGSLDSGWQLGRELLVCLLACLFLTVWPLVGWVWSNDWPNPTPMSIWTGVNIF